MNAGDLVFCFLLPLVSAAVIPYDSDDLQTRDAFGNPALYEGDILQTNGDRHAVRDSRRLWPGKLIYYTIDSSLSKRDVQNLILLSVGLRLFTAKLWRRIQPPRHPESHEGD